MPYIKQDARDGLASPLKDLINEIETVGELNYVITKLAHAFIGPDCGYTEYNAVIGVLESAKLEFYRRKVAEYEDVKIFENGDV